MSKHKRINHRGGPSHERWLVSYADFITLLFAFFVMLYSVSSLNVGKYDKFSESIEKAFSKKDLKPTAMQSGEATNDVVRQNDFFLGQKGDARSQDHQLDNTLSQLADSITKQFQPLVTAGQIDIKREKDFIAIELKSNLLFDTGEGFPKKEALPVLNSLAGLLKSTVNPLRVEGYTDNVPIENDLYPSNWDLSAARAASIVRKLQEFGVEPSRMMAVGYGEQNATYPNDVEENRSKNRRVVIVITANPKWQKGNESGTNLAPLN